MTKQQKMAVDSVLHRRQVPTMKLRIGEQSSQRTLVKSRYSGLQIASTTDFSSTVYVNPGYYAPFNNDPGANVIGFYQTYLVRSASCIVTPACGTTTPGNHYLSYFDNPEIIHKTFSGYTPAALLALCKADARVVSGPIWQTLTLPMTGGPRRKKFSVDSDTPSSAEVADRTTQGVFIYATEGIPEGEPGIPICTLSLSYVAEGYDLQLRGVSGI